MIHFLTVTLEKEYGLKTLQIMIGDDEFNADTMAKRQHVVNTLALIKRLIGSFQATVFKALVYKSFNY